MPKKRKSDEPTYIERDSAKKSKIDQRDSNLKQSSSTKKRQQEFKSKASPIFLCTSTQIECIL